ncbi:transaldolase [bacterium]
MKNKIQELAEYGQSVWLDNISRDIINSGKLDELIKNGLCGMTSNPTIFQKAVSASSAYDEIIKANSGKSTFEIYDELTIKDIQDAADKFKDLYEATNGRDGYVSLEINPKLAHDAIATIEEGKRLHAKVNRKNLMLKIPATDQGFLAIADLVGEGFNINVTLIFSPEQYEKTTEAFIDGLILLDKEGGDLREVHSVASVFVSRIDALVDSKLNDETLKGQAAVSNSRIIYQKYFDIFNAHDFADLGKLGANKQRVLWASTGTKNTDYSDVKYIDELIAKNTVNTMPEATLKAYLDHGKFQIDFEKNLAEGYELMVKLGTVGIDMKDVYQTLLTQGVDSFIKSFEDLLTDIEKKAAVLK